MALLIEKEMPWLRGISCKEEYEKLIVLMDDLVEDSIVNELLIDLLFPALERYENEAEQFRAFNEHIASMDPGVAALAVLIDQYKLTPDDLREVLGAEPHVSMILNGQRSLTSAQIRALSERFGIPEVIFIDNQF